MNERILQLAIEARKYAESKPDIYQVAYDKKFAELIVQECLGKVAEAAHARRDQFFAYSQILEHFGVEE